MTENTIRASSLWNLLDCAYRWAVIYIWGLDLPTQVPALVGTAVHRSTGIYDMGRLGEGRQPISIDDASAYAIDTIRHPEEEIDWLHSDISKKDAERNALLCHTQYCNKIAPSRAYVGVELSLDPLTVVTSNGVELTLTGMLDRIRKEGTRQGVSDLKTGARAVSADGTAHIGRHGPQLGVYQLLAENTLGLDMTLPSEIIGLQTGSKARVGTALVPNARNALVGTEEYPGFLDYVAVKFKTGLFDPNPGSVLCTPKYCPAWDTCPYHD